MRNPGARGLRLSEANQPDFGASDALTTDRADMPLVVKIIETIHHKGQETRFRQRVSHPPRLPEASAVVEECSTADRRYPMCLVGAPTVYP